MTLAGDCECGYKALNCEAKCDSLDGVPKAHVDEVVSHEGQHLLDSLLIRDPLSSDWLGLPNIRMRSENMLHSGYHVDDGQGWERNCGCTANLDRRMIALEQEQPDIKARTSVRLMNLLTSKPLKIKCADNYCFLCRAQADTKNCTCWDFK